MVPLTLGAVLTVQSLLVMHVKNKKIRVFSWLEGCRESTLITPLGTTNTCLLKVAINNLSAPN